MDYTAYQRDHYWKVVIEREAVSLDSLEDDMKCPWCDGKGSFHSGVQYDGILDCDYCRATGWVNWLRWLIAKLIRLVELG